MSNSISFFNTGRRTCFLLGALVFWAGSGLVAGSANAQIVRTARITTVAVPQSPLPRQVTLRVQLDATGKETTFAFSFNYNPAVLTNPVVAVGDGVPAGTFFDTNTANAGAGRVGVLVDTVAPYEAGTRNVATIIFTVAPGAPLGLYPVTFGDSPANRGLTITGGGDLVTPVYVNGAVQVGSTAAGVEVAGRVLTPDGRGIRNAKVNFTSAGAKRTATTSSFGYFRFENVVTGKTYSVSVASKHYRFSPRVIQVIDSVADFDFVGQQ